MASEDGAMPWADAPDDSMQRQAGQKQPGHVRAHCAYESLRRNLSHPGTGVDSLTLVLGFAPGMSPGGRAKQSDEFADSCWSDMTMSG